MKKPFLIVIALLVFSFAKGQDVYHYFQNKGIQLLASYTYPNGQFKSGYYYGSRSPKFIDVYITYQDGTEIILRVYLADPFFSRIAIMKDTNGDQPFLPVEKIMNIAIREATKHKKEDIEKVQAYMKAEFDIDPENWDGKMWTLFVLNLDYSSK